MNEHKIYPVVGIDSSLLNLIGCHFGLGIVFASSSVSLPYFNVSIVTVFVEASSILIRALPK